MPIDTSLKAVVLGEDFGDTTEVLRHAAAYPALTSEMYRCVWEDGAPKLRQ
jgi:hypothetical protein